MKHILFASLFAIPVLSSAQKLPQASPPGHVEQIVGLTTIKVDYSRPSKRERVIFGNLVPYNRVWRTGANKCTTISTDGPVLIEGERLPAGTYALFTIPGPDMWTFIFNSDTSLWGEADRRDSADVLRVKVLVGKSYGTVETFTMSFGQVRDDRAVLELAWEDTRISIGMYADATEQSLLNIQKAVTDPKADFGVFNRCARFCVDRNVMLDRALVWAEKSVSLERKYWNLYTLALARAANGKTPEAIAAAEESMKLAQAERAEDYVKMNKQKIEEWSVVKQTAR